METWSTELDKSIYYGPDFSLSLSQARVPTHPTPKKKHKQLDGPEKK